MRISIEISWLAQHYGGKTYTDFCPSDQAKLSRYFLVSIDGLLRQLIDGSLRL
jgi:hypothetical protein